jgi:hypothetical protein
MFGPHHATSLSAAECKVLIEALEREMRRLKREADKHRDAYDRQAWAKATSQWHLASSLWGRLKAELEEFPEPTAEERDWEEGRLRRLAERLPRSAANAVAHHADVVERRRIAEARRVAFWEGRGQRAGDKEKGPSGCFA